MSTMRGSGRGLSLGRAVGAGDHGTVHCSGRAGARIEWAGRGASVGAELEECGQDCEGGREIRPAPREAPAGHVIGIDEVSRRKGQVYLTVVYDLERRVLLWVGDERTEEAVRPF